MTISSCDFSSSFNLVEEVLLQVQKIMNLHVFLNFKFVATTSINFDFYMFRGSVDTFFLVINYLSDFWTHVDAIVGLFEVHDTTRVSMVR
jgi:hypothetical protein